LIRIMFWGCERPVLGARRSAILVSVVSKSSVP
jgi:hypothetical protein